MVVRAFSASFRSASPLGWLGFGQDDNWGSESPPVRLRRRSGLARHDKCEQTPTRETAARRKVKAESGILETKV
jgi:hypothetical protein